MLRFWKGISIILVMGLVVLNLLPYEATETFTFRGKSTLHLNIETRKMTDDGWTPVLIFLKDLEIFLWMDADGRVAEMRDPDSQSTHILFRIDAINRNLLVGDSQHPLISKGQSAWRTRMSLLNTDLPLALRLDKMTNRASLLIGENSLDFLHIRAEFVEENTGSHELLLRGPGIRTLTRLIYMDDTGSIYSTRRHKGAVDLAQSRIWATKAK